LSRFSHFKADGKIPASEREGNRNRIVASESINFFITIKVIVLLIKPCQSSDANKIKSMLKLNQHALKGNINP
jgi:hypothetical protein